MAPALVKHLEDGLDPASACVYMKMCSQGTIHNILSAFKALIYLFPLITLKSGLVVFFSATPLVEINRKDEVIPLITIS